MSATLLQPMLHHPLGWKPSTTCYTDHYKWRKYGSTSKDKLRSTYSQRYQRQLRKPKQTTQRSPLTPNGEQPPNRIIVLREPENKQEQVKTYRYLPTKTPVYIVEHQQRPATAYADSVGCTQVLERPPTAPAAVPETTSSSTSVEEHQPSNEEKQKRPVNADNDNSRHWLTFPNPKIPQNIIDAKQRLGQLNVSSTLARPSSASNVSVEKQQTTQPIIRPATASVQQKQSTNDNEHQFLSFEKRQTPDDLRAARHRIDKYRYHPSLDNYPPRPQTCPEHRYDSPKPKTPAESKNEQVPTPQLKTDVWVAEEEREPTLSHGQSSSEYVQVINCDNLPNEYATALEISNAAQREYERSVKMNAARRPDNLVYRLPTMLPDKKHVSFAAYPNSPQSTGMNNPLRQVIRSSDNDLGVWIRNATDKERASAMKIVQDVLNPSIMGYDLHSKQTSNRSVSATRKLGHTRTQHKFPCEICEKLLIKRHVWDLTGSEAYRCPRHPQSIQV